MHDSAENTSASADPPQPSSFAGSGPLPSSSSVVPHAEHGECAHDVNTAPRKTAEDSGLDSNPALPASTSAGLNSSGCTSSSEANSPALPQDEEPALTYFPSAYSGRISFIPPPEYNGVQHVSGAFYPRGGGAPIYPTPSIVLSLQQQNTIIRDRTTVYTGDSTVYDRGSGVPGSPRPSLRGDASPRLQQPPVTPMMAGSPERYNYDACGASSQQHGTTTSVNAPSASSASWGNGVEVVYSTSSSPLQSSRVSAIGDSFSDVIRRKLGSDGASKGGAGYFIASGGESTSPASFGIKGGTKMKEALGTPWSAAVEGGPGVEKVILATGEAAGTEPTRLSPQTKMVRYVRAEDSAVAAEHYRHRPLPPSLLASKSENEKQYIEELNAVDHAGAVSISKMPYVPLPLLERLHMHHVHGLRAPPRTHFLESLFPLIRVRTRRGPHGVCDVGTLDVKQFVRRLQLAVSGYYDDMKRLIGPPDMTFPSMGICASNGRPPVPLIYQVVSAPNCPHCGYQLLLKSTAPLPGFLQAVEAPQLPAPQHTGITSPQNCFDRWAQWHCSLCGDVGEAFDENILGCPGIAACGETGECVDQLVAEGIQGLAHCMKNNCFSWPRGAQQVIEGYPLYEPDPTLCRKERPTSLTGNICIDQLNAFLDACLVEPHKGKEYPAPPPIPDTQRTGNWLIDMTNSILDRCCEQTVPLPPPPPPKRCCPPVEMLIPPCCRTRELPPPPPPPPETCPLLKLCRKNPKECPQCHQPVGGSKRRGGTCPAERDPCGGGTVECCLRGTNHYVPDATPAPCLAPPFQAPAVELIEVPRFVEAGDNTLYEAAPPALAVRSPSPCRIDTPRVRVVSVAPADREKWCAQPPGKDDNTFDLAVSLSVTRSEGE
ncbi:hypothetical protein CSUI_007881 [Cystoisospora suis]|uniref:Uncharacterized protein n=1 Tax=Cystoisospora suis TaxID=483139 RepID=A0A2C6KNV5_9APIC|nr:hypothetical protein CSUI_007881 [Cystoisospora suis]